MKISQMISVVFFSAGMTCSIAIAKATPAYKVFGKTVTVDAVSKANKSAFYEIDKKRYELINQAAKDSYLEGFFAKLAKKEKNTVDKARENYFAKNLKISEKEVKDTLKKFKDHPQLSKLPKEERIQQIRDYLSGRDQRVILENIIAAGLAKGDLKVMMEVPREPTYDVVVSNDDWVRYGPKPDNIKPMGCSSDCPITVVEYSEFECPFCARVIPDVKRLLTEYKGKIRWVVRDFPLSFHQRARPAAVAAICAGEQNKFWHMYTKLFESQTELGDDKFVAHAKAIGVYNAKFKKCIANPAQAMSRIDKNMSTGAKHGVTGTPAFFINGRRLSGALPYAQFK